MDKCTNGRNKKINKALIGINRNRKVFGLEPINNYFEYREIMER